MTTPTNPPSHRRARNICIFVPDLFYVVCWPEHSRCRRGTHREFRFLTSLCSCLLFAWAIYTRSCKWACIQYGVISEMNAESCGFWPIQAFYHIFCACRTASVPASFLLSIGILVRRMCACRTVLLYLFAFFLSYTPTTRLACRIAVPGT